MGDQIPLPTAGTDQYPYTADGSFIRPPGQPFLELMAALGYIAACTSRTRLGNTVIILPYRNPIVAAKVFASLDVLRGNRAIYGMGWLENEFDPLSVSYTDRGARSDECLVILKCLWARKNPEFHERSYDFEGVHHLTYDFRTASRGCGQPDHGTLRREGHDRGMRLQTEVISLDALIGTAPGARSRSKNRASTRRTRWDGRTAL